MDGQPGFKRDGNHGWRLTAAIWTLALSMVLGGGCRSSSGAGPTPAKAGASAPEKAVVPAPEKAVAPTPAAAGEPVPGAEALATLTAADAARIMESLNAVALPKGKEGVRLEKFVTMMNEPVKAPTAATLRWEDQGLTVIFDCEDKELKFLPTRERDHEDIWKDDNVDVFLDIGRRRNTIDNRWVHVIVTANGVEYDERGPLVYWKTTAEPYKANVGWNLPGLKTRVEKTGKGWRAEIFIPWEAIGGEPAVGEVWGFNLNRTVWPEEEYQALSPTRGTFYNSDTWKILFFTAKPLAEDPGMLTELLRQLKVVMAPKGATGATAAGFLTPTGYPITNEVTTATTSWDDQGLKIAVDCEDAKVVSKPQKRDDIDNIWTSNDTVEVFLDIGNRRDPTSSNWFQLMLSADGSLADACGPMEWWPKSKSFLTGLLPAVPKGGKLAWNTPGLTVKAEKTARGWRGEFFLPWEGLGGRPKSGDVWGYNIARNNWEPGKVDPSQIQVMAPTVSYFLHITRWGYLMFVEKPYDLKPSPFMVAQKPPAPGPEAPKTGENILYNGDFRKLLDGWSGSNGPLPNVFKKDVPKKGSFAGPYAIEERSDQRGNVCHMPVLRGTLISRPFPIDPGCRYQLRCHIDAAADNAFNMGSELRMYVYGYRWKPGVKPHAGVPKLEELEFVWRSREVKGRDPLAWNLRDQELMYPSGNSTLVFPQPDDGVTDQRTWRQVQFAALNVFSCMATTGHGLEGLAHHVLSEVQVKRIE